MQNSDFLISFSRLCFLKDFLKCSSFLPGAFHRPYKEGGGHMSVVSQWKPKFKALTTAILFSSHIKVLCVAITNTSDLLFLIFRESDSSVPSPSQKGKKSANTILLQKLQDTFINHQQESVWLQLTT